jgi:hypothetical protein
MRADLKVQGIGKRGRTQRVENLGANSPLPQKEKLKCIATKHSSVRPSAYY